MILTCPLCKGARYLMITGADPITCTACRGDGTISFERQKHLTRGAIKRLNPHVGEAAITQALKAIYYD